jgi:hypothetical protein
MEVRSAREIITQAKKDDTYGGAMPEDDATCIKEAENLVEMAEQAWAQHIRGPEVEAILNIANGGHNMNGDAPEPEAEAETEDAPQEEEATVKKLDFAPNLTKMEPWEGYGDDTVQNITEGVNYYLEEKGDDLVELLTHVYAFESTHKKRVRILNHVEEALKRNGVEFGEEETHDDESVDEPEQPEAETPVEPEAEAEVETEPDKIEQKPPAQSNAYRTLIERVEADLKNERLDIPKAPGEPAPELPWRWADITNQQLQDFHMQFASFAYYKQYVANRDERMAMLCKEAADEIRNKLLVELPKYDEKNKEIKVTVLEAQIEGSDAVRRWRKLQRKHEQMALQAKREMESYHKLVEALSRLETMRDNAHKRSGGK